MQFAFGKTNFGSCAAKKVATDYTDLHELFWVGEKLARRFRKFHRKLFY